MLMTRVLLMIKTLFESGPSGIHIPLVECIPTKWWPLHVQTFSRIKMRNETNVGYFARNAFEAVTPTDVLLCFASPWKSIVHSSSYQRAGCLKRWRGAVHKSRKCSNLLSRPDLNSLDIIKMPNSHSCSNFSQLFSFQRIDWSCSLEDKNNCDLKGKSDPECQNYIRVLSVIGKMHFLFVV